MRKFLNARLRPAPSLLTRRFDVEITDTEYQSSAGATLLVRIYRPRGVAPFAAALDVHGGDWMYGDRHQQAVLDTALAANGVLVAAVDYRLAPRWPYPASVEDVAFAFDWLATTLAPDLPKGFVGSSAGGHLALLAALHADTERVAFVVADAPVTDPERHVARRPEPHPYWSSTEDLVGGSPLRIVERRQFQQLPPLLITHGSADEVVPLSMSESFVNAYRAAGGQAELLVFNGLGHAFILTGPRRRESVRQAEAVLAFIRQHTTSAVRGMPDS